MNDLTSAKKELRRYYGWLLLDGIEQVRVYRRIQKEYPNFWALTPYPALLATLRERLMALLGMV